MAVDQSTSMFQEVKSQKGRNRALNAKALLISDLDLTDEQIINLLGYIKNHILSTDRSIRTRRGKASWTKQDLELVDFVLQRYTKPQKLNERTTEQVKKFRSIQKELRSIQDQMELRDAVSMPATGQDSQRPPGPGETAINHRPI